MNRNDLKGLLLFVGLTLFSSAAHADEPKVGKPVPSPRPASAREPSLAGFGPSLPLNRCTLSFRGCMSGCSKSNIDHCAQDCLLDCDVCALDGDMDSPKVCNE